MQGAGITGFVERESASAIDIVPAAQKSDTLRLSPSSKSEELLGGVLYRSRDKTPRRHEFHCFIPPGFDSSRGTSRFTGVAIIESYVRRLGALVRARA